VATSIAKDVNTLIFKATVNLVKESVRYQYMKSLQSEMDTQLVKLRKLSLEKYLNDEKVKKEVMVAKKRHIRILIACIIFDKVSAESLSSKVDEIYLCSTKDFDNGYTYIKHALKAEIKSESDENFLKQIKQIFWEIKMDRVLDIVGTNVTPDSIQNLTGEITNLVRTRNFTAADQMLANGQLSPAAYIGTTVVSSISGYLKASQENERALTIMINQISHDVIASSEKMITKMVELSEKKMDLVKHITNKCNEIIENAAKDAQDKIFQLQTQGIDYERITQFSQGNAKLALAALNAEEKTLTSAIDAINGNLKTATEAANKQCESLKSIINDLTKDEAKFFGECIEFYKNMITRAQNTLDGVRKDNVSIVKKLIDEGASLLKETIVSKKTDLESQDESKKQSTSIGDAKTTTTTSTSTTSSNAESATQDNTTEATKTTSTTTTTNAEAMRNFGMHSTKKEASQNADVAELDWPEGIEYRQNDTNGMHELVITIRKLRSSDKFQSICDKINEFRDDADKSIKSEQGYCTMIGFNDPRNIKELYDEINKLSADASPKMQQ